MSDNIDVIEKLTEEVSQLRDLFTRRLYEDKTKNQVCDTLTAQNASLNKQLEGKQLESLFKELLLICDRIEAQEDSSDFLDSVHEEIIEVFARRDISPIEMPIELLHQFNPQYQKAIETVQATEECPHGTVVAIKRKGYFIQDRILRPAEVVVAVQQQEQ